MEHIIRSDDFPCSFDVEEPRLRDTYLRKAKEQKWRSRSSFKLLQIDERFNIFEGVKRIVELFASPGTWTQVLSRKLVLGEKIYINNQRLLFYNELALNQRLEAKQEPEYEYTGDNGDVVIVAHDAYDTPDYPGVIKLGGELRNYATIQHILKHLDGHKADLIVCKEFIDRTELRSIDVNIQGNHVILVMYTACHILKPGGTLVVAVYRETDNDLIKSQLLLLFKDVDFYRPKVIRYSAKELYAVCKNFSPPEGFDPKLMEPFLDFCNRSFYSLSGINRIVIPFLICGDVSTYPLPPYLERQIKKYTRAGKDEPSTSKVEFKLGDLDNYLKKMDEAMRRVTLEDNPDYKEMQIVKERMSKASGSGEAKSEEGEASCKDEYSDDEEEFIDNGPLFELIQKTTKAKEFTYRGHKCESHPPEEDLQFLYEDETTDPEMIRECLERVRSTFRSSTCTCEFP